ncbi:MAG: hypothetical protein ACM3NQ_05710, partial [Bacteroidales bacterium]
MTWKQVSATAVFVGSLGMAAIAHAQQPAQQPPAGASKADAVAALKQSLQQGLAKARAYEWVETTIISMKGEEKSRKQQRCYYGADGKVQKVPIEGQQTAAQPAKSSAGRGGRGGKLKQQVIENKKEEISEYMKKAVQLIHGYVPPDPAKIQAAKDAGRVKVNPQGGGTAQVVIADYQLPGDSMTISLDPAAGKLLGLGVNSYIEK